MKYPCVKIDLNKIKHNTNHLVKMCSQYDIEVTGVTKVFCANPSIVQAMVEGGITAIADSRIENFKKSIIFPLPKLFLRLPMISEAEDVVRYADISLNSELDTIKALSEQAVIKDIKHKIILMIDLGDLREGIWSMDEIMQTAEETIALEGVELYGLGTNLTCYGGIIPNKDNLGQLMTLKEKIEEKYSIQLKVVSGGNSSSLHIIESGEMPRGINHLRLGESIILGRETAFGNRIPDTFDDALILQCEIIELKEKPSIPIGEIGMDAFGNKPTFEDRGIRKRALCAIGKQDVDVNDIIPIDDKIRILGGSSDHLILDVTDCDENYKIGSILSFKLTYGGVLRSFTSPYVKKNYVE